MVARDSTVGFTLVEAMFSIVILTISALGLTKTLIHAQYTAEDNLYEATALTVAISTIEQMKGASLTALSNPPSNNGAKTFKMIVGNGETSLLKLDQPNEIKIPIITDDTGKSAKDLPLTITPSITENLNNSGYWLEIDYAYDHPRSGRTRTQTIRNMRSTIAVY